MIAAEAGPAVVRAKAAALLLRNGRLYDSGGRRGWLEAAGQGVIAGMVAAAIAILPADGSRAVQTGVGDLAAGSEQLRTEPGPENAGGQGSVTSDAGEASAGARGTARTGGAAARPTVSSQAGRRVAVDGTADQSRDGASQPHRFAQAADELDVSAECGARVAGTVTAEDAEKLVGEQLAVEFRVATTKDTGRVTFLNSHVSYQGRFYVAIFPDDYSAFPPSPEVHFDGACVVIQGRVELYRGAPQIVLRHPADIVVVGH